MRSAAKLGTKEAKMHRVITRALLAMLLTVAAAAGY
jgi:hypothetical protein